MHAFISRGTVTASAIERLHKVIGNVPNGVTACRVRRVAFGDEFFGGSLVWILARDAGDGMYGTGVLVRGGCVRSVVSGCCVV